MSHIYIHHSLEDLKDFILSVFHDSLLLYPEENNDSLFVWCLTYVRLIRLNNNQKFQLKKIASEINNFYNDDPKVYNMDDYNNIILFTHHVWSLFLKRDIDIKLHLKKSENIIKNLFTKNPEQIEDKNIEVINNMRRSIDVVPQKNDEITELLDSTSLLKSKSDPKLKKIDNIEVNTEEVSKVPKRKYIKTVKQIS